MDDPITILPQYKFLGTPTLQKPSKGDTNKFNTFILLYSLDILLGNMQFTLVKQHRSFLKDATPPVANQTTYIFDHHMANSLNKLYNRFKRAPYIQQWIFKKPSTTTSELPITASDWVPTFRELILSSLVRPTLTTSPLPNDSLLLTSTLDSESSSDDG